MDEFTAVLKARGFVRKANPTTIPVPMDAYLEQIGACLKLNKSMGADEAGCSFELGGKRYISVNANDRSERRRFTICHEVAHIVLGLPSEHGIMPCWSYAKRSPSEIACDVFAAELLLPYWLFKSLVDKAEISFAAIADLARQFKASRTATGSRFATLTQMPCAFILGEQGKIRFSVCSRALRDVKAWISRGVSLPSGSQAEKLRKGGIYEGPEEIAADLWFENWAISGFPNQ